MQAEALNQYLIESLVWGKFSNLEVDFVKKK